MFTAKERAGFKYTFAHWCAFQMTALNMRIWKFKYLFHDIEKPFLMLLFKDYSKVQKIHRKYNRHHLEYEGAKGIDFEALIIDWECSHHTKEKSQRRVREECYNKIAQGHPKSDVIKNKIIPLLEKYNL